MEHFDSVESMILTVVLKEEVEGQEYCDLLGLEKPGRHVLGDCLVLEDFLLVLEDFHLVLE